jgi:hypothetical protein
MGEISDLIGIYGAIERAVVSDPERRAAVAQVLPIYGDETVEDVDEFKWFDELEDWTREKSGIASDASPFPSADAALKELATIEPVGRMRARRMLAIAALARAIPDYANPATPQGRLAQQALGFETLTDDHERVSSLLHRLLTDQSEDAELTPDEWWARMLARASDERVLFDDPALIGHRPCTAGLVRVPVSVPGPGSVFATALKTEFESVGIEFDRVIRFLDPANWTCCNGFWCEMKFVETMPSGAQHFHEVVSLDCPNKDHTWSIEAELAFTHRKFTDPRVAATEYHLVPPHPLANDDVLVDAGVLTVEELDPPPVSRLRVTTTKRVYFTRHFPGPGLALFMCAVGYAAIAEDFVYTCAIDPAKEGSDFNPHRKEGHTGPRPPLQPVIKQFADEIADATKACIRDLAQMAQETSEKIEAKHYGADDLAQDAAGLWLKSFREGAKAVDLGVRSAEAAAARARRPPEEED